MLKTASLLVLLVVLPVWGRSRFAGKWPFERAIEDEVTPPCEADGVKYKVMYRTFSYIPVPYA